MRVKQPLPALVRRCRVNASLVFVLLATMTIALWQMSIVFLDLRLEEVLSSGGQQSIQRLSSFLSDRLFALRYVSHFCANSEDVTQQEFDRFCSSLMADVPGLLLVMQTDGQGVPQRVSPPEAMPQGKLYSLTGSPKLAETMKLSRQRMQPTMTDPISDIGELGGGFMVVTPIAKGQRTMGFVIGIFGYQALYNNLMMPDITQTYRVTIRHGNRVVLPLLGAVGAAGNEEAGVQPQTQRVVLGGQEWDIAVQPLREPRATAGNFASLTILGLGLILSIVLSLIFFRWQWRAALLQTDARDSRTRLERAGTSLVEIKGQLDLIMNSVGEGIVLYDLNLAPVQANAAFLTTFGLTEVGAAMRDAHAHHEHMIRFTGVESKYRSVFDVLARNPEQTFTDELEIRAGRGQKGATRVFQRHATNIIGANDEPRGTLVIYRDTTSVKSMNRIKDEFLASVTHELRSPLASIKGFAETMARDPEMPQATRSEFVSIILEESTRLQDLIEELLDLRRLEGQAVVPQMIHYDFRTLVEDVVRAARSMMISKNVNAHVQWEGAIDDFTLMGDVAQISRAIRNLLVNAIKYSPEGGRIEVRGSVGAQHVYLEIVDQGTGIADKDLPHIFDKFYRGSSQGYQKGTGLGLAMVKHILESHGGHLGVRSEVGAGTAFRLELPRFYSAPAPAVVGAGTGLQAGETA